MKKGLERYLNPQDQIEYSKNYNKQKYQSFNFNLDKKKDRKLIEYFMKSKNKTEALRKLYKGGKNK